MDTVPLMTAPRDMEMVPATMLPYTRAVLSRERPFFTTMSPVMVPEQWNSSPVTLPEMAVLSNHEKIIFKSQLQ